MTTLVDVPARVDGVQLIGEMVGSGYRSPPALVRRADGQVLQLTPLLYLVLSSADGERSHAQIAECVGARLGRAVSEADVRTLVERHLRPLGLLKLADGTEPELRRSNPLLRLKPRVAVTNPQTTRRLTDPFRVLFNPMVTTAMVLGFAAIVVWVFFDRGLGASAYDAFERPHLLLLVFVVSVLSAGFHEFGHAAAARYGGSEPGAMGAGFYLVWPAFYTDVTDSYRLGRAGRIRTDLGGLYFNAIVVVLTFVWWWSTGWEALLLLVATQVLQMVQQVLPLLRFDGYHVLADLAGVPDLYHRIRPTLLGLLPHRWKAPENKVLTPWARLAITVWVLVTIPMMALMMFALVRAVPRVLGSAGSALSKDAASVADAWEAGSVIDVAAHSVQVLGVVLPIGAAAMVLSRTGYRFFRGLARWSRGSTPKRVAAAALTASLITALAWAWWPNPGAYRPIQPGERGRITTLLNVRHSHLTAQLTTSTTSVFKRGGTGFAGGAAQTRLASGRPLVAAFEKGQRLPTKEHPAFAMVLVPDGSAVAPSDRTSTGAPTSSGPGGATDQPWVFPFDKPLPPAQGDNQALAVNTTDGSMKYDLAFALVWAEGNEVLNVNEAHAYASCTDCVAVAVAFQVVLIVDDAQVIVPQNLAVAATYDCYRCITAAIAQQLVLSVPGEPTAEQLRALGEVWNRLMAFAGTITTRPLSEITEQLDSYQAEIVAILGESPTVAAQTSSTTGTSPTTSASPSPSPAPSTPEAGSTPTTALPSSESGTSAPSSTSSEPATPSPSPAPQTSSTSPAATSSTSPAAPPASSSTTSSSAAPAPAATSPAASSVDASSPSATTAP